MKSFGAHGERRRSYNYKMNYIDVILKEIKKFNPLFSVTFIESSILQIPLEIVCSDWS